MAVQPRGVFSAVELLLLLGCISADVLAGKQSVIYTDFCLALKVLTNEKRGGLTMVSFDRSPVKLFSLWVLYESMKAPSCERPKTNQRTLFLSFAINNCYSTSDEKLLAAFELFWGIFTTVKPTIRLVSFDLFGRFLKLHHRCYKYRWSTFANTPNVAWIVSVIWKDLLWRPDFSCHFK
jgi:hypothetical protein